ncbi:alpha,alpha-trehalase TreF [Acetobacter estunensis]|uniref:alpha,alpha-trehalase TreF n=1 Tax=Acetobacter estunensis TaxID=104097 RepID=UPI0020C50A7B|nr:alpha,alpha-trehalase TreF [Acetobacter estunensis]
MTRRTAHIRFSRFLASGILALTAGSALAPAAHAQTAGETMTVSSDTAPVTPEAASPDDVPVLLHPAIIPPPQAARLPEHQDLRPPSIILDGLFDAIGRARIFTDAKAAADAYPNRPPEEILAAWRSQNDQPGFDLKTFVATWFTVPAIVSAAYQRTPDESVRDYISGMWDVLTRQPDTPVPWSSLLTQPQRYVVPGGRFSELYYWDSYFTMIGLYEDNRVDLLRSTFICLASMIDRYGHIPNGARTYYLGRSQPAFFAMMLDLLAQHDGKSIYVKYLPELQKEYAYWTDGEASLKPGQAWRHAVRLRDGSFLTRPWDDFDTPRDESYPQDIATARTTDRPAHELWRDLRAGSETGWDFSSRWLADGHTLSTIRTTDLVTIEMSVAVAHLVQTLAKAHELAGHKMQARHYAAEAARRVATVQRVFWDAERKAFIDYDWKTDTHTGVLSAATVVPLFFNMATPEQGHAVAQTVRESLLKPGGIAASTVTSGQQWDAPNGWAPYQWMAVKGLSAYKEDALAEDVARRWMTRVIGTYEKSGVLLEKYDVVSPTIQKDGGTGGGEYPMQIGFGWTNGTLVGMMNRYPRLTQQILNHNPQAGQESKIEDTPGDGLQPNAPPIATVVHPTLKGQAASQESVPRDGVPLSPDHP